MDLRYAVGIDNAGSIVHGYMGLGDLEMEQPDHVEAVVAVVG